MRYLLACCVGLTLIGCDQFPGPDIRSEFPTHTNIIVSYSDGNVFSHDWPSCDVYLLGAMEIGRWGVKPREGVSIDEIIIEAEGKVIHRFDKAAIDNLINEAEKMPGYLIWVADNSGIRFSTERECVLSEGQ